MKNDLDGCLKSSTEDIVATVLDLAGTPKICQAKDVGGTFDYVDLAAWQGAGTSAERTKGKTRITRSRGMSSE